VLSIASTVATPSLKFPALISAIELVVEASLDTTDTPGTRGTAKNAKMHRIIITVAVAATQNHRRFFISVSFAANASRAARVASSEEEPQLVDRVDVDDDALRFVDVEVDKLLVGLLGTRGRV
jgi:hypothetical protein